MMNLIVAFFAEARPLIEYFGLSQICTSPIPIYQKEHIQLGLCGLGKAKAKEATAFMSNNPSQIPQAWINLGIAGHGSMDIGEAFIAGKIVDDQDSASFYPPQIYPDSLPLSPLLTCTTPQSSYKTGMGYDMEAHAFYQVACQKSLRELTQVIKVVSDNPSSPMSEFLPKRATTLIENKLPVIIDFLNHIENAAEELRPQQDIVLLHQDIVNRHHFSVTHSHQLKDLIRHTVALGLGVEEIYQKVRDAHDASATIRALSAWIEDRKPFV